MRYILIIFFSFHIQSEPWINVSDSRELNYISHQLKNCKDWDKGFISLPVSYGAINFHLEEINERNSENITCRKNVDKVKESIKEKFILSREIIFGFQSGTKDQYFQTRDNRYYKTDNHYISISDINSNFAYKIKVRNANKERKIYFDESYISYKYKNHIFTAGRINHWWSPSDNYSLIMSNSARPSPGLEYKNYVPIKPQNKILKILGSVNYEFFLNRLEKNREISNALLFGNKVTFKPHDTFKFSLLRLAQFGGDNRPNDARTILKMILGNDNQTENLSDLKQPGNQLGGLDFIYNPSNISNLKIYGQTIGEDEAGYLPSGRMSLIGFSYYFNSQNNEKFSLDYIDTYAGIKNMAYNHFLYKSGLRYHGIPIGASIDADSEALKLTLSRKYNDLFFEFAFSDIHLNKNNSLLNYWTKESVSFNQFDLLVKYNYKKSYIDLIYTYRDQNFNHFRKNNLSVNLYFKF